LEDQPLSTFGNTISQLWFLIDAAKVMIFFHSAKHLPAFFVFHGNRYANALHRMATGTFFVPRPGLPPPKVAIQADFHKNSTTSLPEMPCLSAFRASRSAKTRSRLPLQPPPPYAGEAIASLCSAEYVKTFRLWKLPACVACRRVPNCHAHPQSWLAMRHEKPEHDAPANTELHVSNNKSECDAQQFAGKAMDARNYAVCLLLTWHGTMIQVVRQLLLMYASHLLHPCQ
jgi:hypothetical protein